MKQGINPGYVQYQRKKEEKRDFSDTLALCRTCGFTELDYLSPLKDENFRDTAHLHRELLNRAGMKVHQSHCPFFRYQENGIRLFPEFAERAVEAASILGAQYLVIHADEYRPADGFNSGEVLAKNYELLAPIVELCLKRNLSPAFENLFEDHFKAADGERSRFCSEPEEVVALIEKFHDPAVGACLDFGHAQCSSGEQYGKVLDLFEQHLFCTHVHDNYYRKDLHLPAFFGTIDWEMVMSRLKTSGYSGNFTWELVYGRFPDALLPEYLKFVHKTGEYLLAL